MTSATEFFARRAEAFRLGRLCDVTRTVSTPMPIYSGDDLNVVRSKTDLMSRLTACRIDLMNEGYARSDHDILASDVLDGGRARFRVRWTHRNHHGGVIARSVMDYFLIRSPEKGWLVTMIDVLVKDTSRLATA